MAEDRKRRNPESDRQFPLHTDVRIKGMDRVTAQLRACVETSSLYLFWLVHIKVIIADSLSVDGSSILPRVAKLLLL